MQYLDGETVADRLPAGPMLRKQVLKLGRDLLDALEHAHAHGVVHRDVKPANVFWDGEDAVLVDFGIAKRVPVAGKRSEESFTEPGARAGTRAYMSPEQLSGAEASPASDLYAAALVIYEAYTARHWLEAQSAGRRVWAGVPWLVRGVLRRALAWTPEDRWPDAATFKRRFWRTRVRQYPLRTLALAAATLVAGAGVTSRVINEAWPFPRAGGLRLVVSPFENVCTVAGRAGDRVARGLVRDLQGYVDFSVAGPAEPPWLTTRSTVLVRGSVCARGDSVRAEVDVGAAVGGSDPAIFARGDTGHLDLLADTLAYGIVREIWNRENPSDAVLPIKALPRTARGLAAWLAAERLLARARWGEADRAYDAAETIDSTCWLCPWRHAQVDKWLGRPADEARAAHYLSHIDSFPPEVRALLWLGLTCRFDGSVACGRALDVALAQTGASQYPDLAAGPRYLMTFDAPAGAVAFGRRFAARDDAPALVESGLVAELSGYLALGLVDSARAAARALHGLGGAELTVLPAELDAALLLLDPRQVAGPARWADIARGLVAHTSSGA